MVSFSDIRYFVAGNPAGFKQTIPDPHWLSDDFRYKFEEWLKLMLKLCPQRRGGGANSQDWFHDLKRILDEKVGCCKTVLVY